MKDVILSLEQDTEAWPKNTNTNTVLLEKNDRYRITNDIQLVNDFQYTDYLGAVVLDNFRTISRSFMFPPTS